MVAIGHQIKMLGYEHTQSICKKSACTGKILAVKVILMQKIMVCVAQGIT